jgi:hypothetical protein
MCISESLKKLGNSFKKSFQHLKKNQLLTVIVLLVLIVIVMFAYKNGNIDLFSVTSTVASTSPTTTGPTTTGPTTTGPTTTRPTTTVPTTTEYEDDDDLLTPRPPLPTNAFTNFNFDFLKTYLNYKDDNLQYIKQMQTQAQVIDSLNNRVGKIIN